jgi:hypothetical protein
MKNAQKATDQKTGAKKEVNPVVKPVLEVVKDAPKQEKIKPVTVVERVERLERMQAIADRRDRVKDMHKTFENFKAGDEGFTTEIVLKNNHGTMLPIKNSEAVKEIFAVLGRRLEESLISADDELLKFEI